MKIVQLSSLEKVFPNSNLKNGDYSRATALKGEKFCYQIAYSAPGLTDVPFGKLRINIVSKLKDHIKIYRVENIPSCLPAYPEKDHHDDDYITLDPGLFPDLLLPAGEEFEIYKYCTRSIWIEISLPEHIAAGEYEISAVFEFQNEKVVKKFKLEIADAVLPPQTLKFTQWFHCDCLKTYYKVEKYSEEHWNIIRNFMKTAADNGINMILTPVITPTLDVDEGGERPDVQLVGICRDGNNYSFDFSRLDKWIELACGCGIKYFEIAHLFTQWGAKAAPKIMGVENGEYKKLFGWDDSATGEAYTNFLKQFVPALTRYFDAKNMRESVYFHVSDEPCRENAQTYEKAQKLILPLLDGYKCMDALSEYEFYEKGLVAIPIVSNNHIHNFIGKNIKELWTYNCCAQNRDVSNRFFAMPSYRNRILGIQMFKYGIKGFLHWGYNFYYSARSRREIDPYTETDAAKNFPSGDAFSVYPGEGGEAYPSLRLIVFNEGLQDMRALEALSEKIGHDAVVKLIEDGLGYEIDFKTYPRDPEYILKLREKVNRMLGK